MKIAYVLLLLSFGVMSVVLFQAGRQEMRLINLKARMVESASLTTREEQSIIGLKTEVEQLKKTVISMNNNIIILKKKKQGTEQLTQGLNKGVQTCNSEKVGSGNKKTETEAAMETLKAGNEEAKKKAEVEIQTLKQQILDRDKAICAFADTTKDEARTLCGLPKAVK
ncbi:hypothetical protein PBY51_017707 [Eleginops maclovinus]|uniref:Uncharacterized protein n=1 Tax=Eleginops maclovinus TaxID=56733 RepID=A0AAN7XK79_ELEMC|nr:hypothetical protein PBY51_017707 [Eleginops maclovinus]